MDINREVGASFPEALAGIILAQIHFEMGEKDLAVTLLEKARLWMCTAAFVNVAASRRRPIF